MNNRFPIPSQAINPLTPPPEKHDEHGEQHDEQYQHREPKEETTGDSMYLEPDSHTALPSPAGTPRDIDYEHDSGTEMEAPSISDWEPTSDSEVLYPLHLLNGKLTNPALPQLTTAARKYNDVDILCHVRKHPLRLGSALSLTDSV